MTTLEMKTKQELIAIIMRKDDVERRLRVELEMNKQKSSDYRFLANLYQLRWY